MYPELIEGFPGAGKTTTLLGIVEQELEKGTPPDRIAYLSFTRKATEEAIDRACKRFGLSQNQFPYFRTIHSLCFKELGIRNSEILERTKLQEFANWIGIRITGKWTEDGTLLGLENGDRIIFLENLARIRGVPLRQLYNESDETVPWSEIDRVVRGLKVFKQENGLMDFTDLLKTYIKQGNVPKLEVLVCDESQDMSSLQWQVIERLAQGVRLVVMCGDNDQNLYSWCGSDSNRFEIQPGNRRTLERSYRVPRNIQNLALSVIERIKDRPSKVWEPRDEGGVIEKVSAFHKVDLSGDDILILARNTYFLYDVIEPELRRQGVIYERNGHLSVKPSVLNAIVDWENLRSGNKVSVSQVINLYDQMSSSIGVKRGFKKLPGRDAEELVDLATLKQDGGLLVDSMWSEALDRIPANDRSYIVAARKRGEKVLKKPRVKISTLHGAKGGEADHVILFTDQARKTHQEMLKNPNSEHRVFYVGTTRSRNRLTIIQPQTNKFYPYI